jgi:hypothetical protein
MKCLNKIPVILIFVILLPFFMKAQIAVNFNPVIYGQSIEGLAYAQIVNSSLGNLIAKVTVKVRTKGLNVVTIVMPSFQIHAGMNEISRAAFSNARFGFGNNNYGLTASQSGKFPEGDYEYCYAVDISESKDPQLPPIYENCFVQELRQRTPLLLINPIDGDEICNKRPQFIWQPPVPLPLDARFRLVLAEVKEKQDIVEAVTYNPPVINQGNIVGNNLFYPANAPDLKQGQKYAWQVIVYSGLAILVRSEVWTFTYKCQEPSKDTTTDSYRELKETSDGDFYIANKYLHFSLNNPYSPGNLAYTIASMVDPDKAIKGLPKLKLNTGLNKYDIDLTENKSFKNGQEYFLIVTIGSNRNLRLRFIYKNE